MNWLWNKKFDKNQIENVCFKGGGMKGLAFVGVDRAMSELGLWKQIKRYIGSSAGAIFAGAAACKIPFETMQKEILATDFSKFCDSRWGITEESYRLYEDLGLYPGEYFYNWYRELLKNCIGDADITLQGVYDRFGSELVITTTDLTLRRVVYLDRQNNPDMKLCDAVRRSMSIPLFFVPVKVQETDGEHVYVDGGYTNNYPIDYFDHLYNKNAFTKTIGFDLVSTFEKSNVHSVTDLLTALINTDIETVEKMRTTPNDISRSVVIDTGDYKSTDFDMPEGHIKNLIDIGYDSTMEFFQKD